MADAADVETALVAQAAAALYPAGSGEGSVTGGVIRLYRGWPGNAGLEADLAAGVSHVSVAMLAQSQKPEDAYPAIWEIPAPVAPGLTVSVGAGQVRFGGSAFEGQLAGVLADDAAFVYRTRAGDTPEMVAANLAVLLGEVRAATVAGATLSVPAAARLIARVAADQAAVLPLRRQRAQFRLTCWCPDPATRDTLAATLDAALAQSAFLTLPDGTAARLRYSDSEITDDLATMPLYRRALAYDVTYTTTLAQTQPSMVFGIFGVSGAAGITGSHLS